MKLKLIPGGLALCLLLAACGDVNDPVLTKVEVLLAGQVVDTLDVAHSGSNFIKKDVDPSATFRLIYDEPVLLETAEAHVFIKDSKGNKVKATIGLRLVDVTVTPGGPMTGGQNHTLVVEPGIDDASKHHRSRVQHHLLRQEVAWRPRS